MTSFLFFIGESLHKIEFGNSKDILYTQDADLMNLVVRIKY